MSKRSSRTTSRPPAGALVLLPPRLQPLSAEERFEAVALLSDLLLEATRRAGDGGDLAIHDRELRKGGLAA